MRLRLLESLDDHATRMPHEPAVRQVAPASAGAQALTHADLARRVWGMAERLTRELSAGEVVLLSCPNDAQFVVSFLAILAAGAKVFPVSPELTEPELIAAAEQTSAAAVVGPQVVLEVLKGRVRKGVPIAEATSRRGAIGRGGRDAAGGGLLLQSSGTTGKAKIVFRPPASLDAVAGAMCEAIGFRPADRVLMSLPLCHSYGLEHGLLAPIMAGSCVHLCRGFDLQLLLKELREGGITIFPGVPFMFEALEQARAQAPAFPALRRAYSAGGPLPAKVFEAFKARHGLAVTQLYGATEIGSVTFSHPDSELFDPASVGAPMRGVDVRILPIEDPRARALPPDCEGQVAVRAASMMSGYLGDDLGDSIIDGYFLTGDLGRLDKLGRLTITGRIKLLIDVGGLKVNPVEVEEVLAQHPDVAACVVLPVRVSETVSRLKAIVTPRRTDGASPDPESLRRFARGRLTPHKVPRLFEVRMSLPRSPTGKVLRNLVSA
jgi:acyl-CoA synthetase (AMP-forming)/AMP-acid ligase II